MQNVGDGVAVVGYAATASVVGAEVDVPMATAGTIISSIGTGWEVVIDFATRDFGNSAKKIGFNVSSKLIKAGLNKVLLGGGNIGTEIITQGAELKISGIERVVDAVIEKKANDKERRVEK
jgi:hypothetical protein